jgi:hypothetical protein
LVPSWAASTEEKNPNTTRRTNDSFMVTIATEKRWEKFPTVEFVARDKYGTRTKSTCLVRQNENYSLFGWSFTLLILHSDRRNLEISFVYHPAKVTIS